MSNPRKLPGEHCSTTDVDVAEVVVVVAVVGDIVLVLVLVLFLVLVFAGLGVAITESARPRVRRAEIGICILAIVFRYINGRTCTNICELIVELR